MIASVSALEILAPGGVQQCNTATLAIFQGTPPYDITIAPGRARTVRIRQNQFSLQWKVDVAAGTTVQFHVLDDDGASADLSLDVESSIDDSCLHSSGDPPPSTTPSATPTSPDVTSTSTSTPSTSPVPTSVTMSSSSGGEDTQSTLQQTSALTSAMSSSPLLPISTPTNTSAAKTSTFTVSVTAPPISLTTASPMSLTPPSSSTTPPSGLQSRLSTAAIAGISAAIATIAVALLGMLCWRCISWRTQRRRAAELLVRNRSAHPLDTTSSSQSDASHKVVAKPDIVKVALPSLAMDGARMSSSHRQSMSTAHPEPSPSDSVLHIHTRELDSVAAQPTVSGPVATSQIVGAVNVTASSHKIPASQGVQSTDHPAKADVAAASQPSPSDLAPLPREDGNGSCTDRGGQVVHELDGGVRLAGGPPDMVHDDEEPLPMATSTLPPPYRRTLSTAAVAGLSTAAVAIAVVVLGVLAWKCRRWRTQRDRADELEDGGERARPFAALPVHPSVVSSKTAMDRRVVTPIPSLPCNNPDASHRQVMPASRSGQIEVVDDAVAVLDMHTHAHGFDAAQPTILGPIATSQSVETLARCDLDPSLGANSVLSAARSAREDVLAPSQPSPSDIVTSPWMWGDDSPMARDSYAVYELDGGIRLAGGPPDMVRGSGDEEGPPLVTLSLPPPYQSCVDNELSPYRSTIPPTVSDEAWTQGGDGAPQTRVSNIYATVRGCNDTLLERPGPDSAMPPPPQARGPASTSQDASTVSISYHNSTGSSPSTSSPDSALPTQTSSEAPYSSASHHLVEVTLHTTTTLHLTRFVTVTLLSRPSESFATQDTFTSETSSLLTTSPAIPMPEASSVSLSIPAIPTFATISDPAITPPSPFSSAPTPSSASSTIWDLPTSDTFTAYLMLQTYSSAGSDSGSSPSTNNTLNAEVLAGMIMGVIAVFVALCSLIVVLSQRKPHLFKSARGAVSRAFSRRRSVDSDVRPLTLSSPTPYTLQLAGATPVTEKVASSAGQEAESDAREASRSLRTSAATGTSETLFLVAQYTGSTAAEPPTPPPPLPDRPEVNTGRTRRASRPPRKRGKIVEDPPIQAHPEA
ncbi:hypothetical protein C8T65DRAFT_755948 [Cerioporus squamosus]|nr:hypothetical protein C8T65DRAFT_755948 [Cerioporus squamosus]